MKNMSQGRKYSEMEECFQPEYQQMQQGKRYKQRERRHTFESDVADFAVFQI